MMSAIALVLTFLSSLLGAYISHRALQGTLPMYYVPITGIIHTFLWTMLLMYSKQTLVSLTAWFDVLIAVGYFTMLWALGAAISSTQLVGIMFLLLGLYFIDK